MRVFRLAQTDFAQSSEQMMCGEGGLYASGRWSTRGQRVAYAADSRALATLEILVNLTRADKLPLYRALEINVPDKLITTLLRHELPAGWDEQDGEPLVSRAVGDDWINVQVSVALAVPSSIIPAEQIVLINPLHPDFDQVRLGDVEDFPFDKRLKR